MIQLTATEKRTIIACLGVAASVAAVALVLQPARARARTLRRIIPQKQQELADVVAKSRQYQTLAAARAEPADPNRPTQPGVALMPFLESLLHEQGLDDFVERQEQSSHAQDGTRDITVEATLRRITFEQLVDLLAAIETAEAATTIRELHVKTRPNEVGLLDVDLELSQG